MLNLTLQSVVYHRLLLLSSGLVFNRLRYTSPLSLMQNYHYQSKLLFFFTFCNTELINSHTYTSLLYINLYEVGNDWSFSHKNFLFQKKYVYKSKWQEFQLRRWGLLCKVSLKRLQILESLFCTVLCVHLSLFVLIYTRYYRKLFLPCKNQSNANNFKICLVIFRPNLTNNKFLAKICNHIIKVSR